MRWFLPALLLAACGARAGDLPEALRGLPPRHDPPIDLADEDDLGRARAAYDALPLADPGRSEQRRQLMAAYRVRIERGLPDSRDQALRWFQQAVGLWDARELADPKRAPADVDVLAPTAEALYREFSSSGSDVEAATALVVLVAARPERAAEYEKTWSDIETYTDGLAVAEAGPGAKGSRPIVMLEAVIDSFPSRWATDKLLELYFARQDRLHKYLLKGGGDPAIRGAFRDRGAARPVWNLVRAYARSGRLAEAPAAVAKLAGQFGDDPELRKRLDTALASQKGEDWIAAAAPFIPSEQAGEGDLATALDICAYGAERLPKDATARKCAAEVARISERVPLSIRWIEEARALAPDDHDSGEIAARLYLGRMADLLQAERLDAARARMNELTAFCADAEKRWPGKPLATTLADVYLVFGRGLFNQGELTEAATYLNRATALRPSPQASEELATIAFKTGRYEQAATGYEGAIAFPRKTPVETSFEGARLRRLAGEAWQQAGNKRKAEALWKEALEAWNDLLAAALSPRARAEAHAEVGRLRYHLREIPAALKSFAQAVDADPDETSVYGDVIAFLVPRGHYEDALDAYHRALGRSEVTDYMKVYSSLWLVDLAAQRGVTPDSLALRYLDNAAKGTRWYHQLARFKVGKSTYEETLRAADTRGKRAEAYFYEAMGRYARGDRATAEKLLGDVIATQMLGFFEYDMARYYLKNGPPHK